MYVWAQREEVLSLESDGVVRENVQNFAKGTLKKEF
jgi:hypothetical protein